jgi:uncharacterized protein
MRSVFLLLGIVVSLFVAGTPHTLSSIPNPKVADSRTYVSNPDGLVSQAAVDQMNVWLDSLAASTQTECAVVLVQSIGDAVVEDFAINLAREWGVGKAANDNGLVILYVADQRAVRFETGYGVEGVLPDALANRIMEETMFPLMREGDIEQGLLKGVERTVAVLRNEKFEPETHQIQWAQLIPYALALYITIALIALFWIRVPVQKYKTPNKSVTNIARYKALKSEKSGIMLILNILLPAIGVFAIVLLKEPLLLLFLLGIPVSTLPANMYGKWMMRTIRRQPIPCSECEGTMHILSEKKEDSYLQLSQQFEEQLHAVDYDVFVCNDCGNQAIFTLDKPSQYTECPRCKTKAFILHDRRVIVAPSYVNHGTERITYKCKFCGYEENNNQQLPRLRRSDTGAFVAGSAAGSLFSGRGGFGGGGGGFGGGSFGGGSFGGGGATGRF